MDAPKGRYRVVEKDGRLVVIDNETAGAIPSSLGSLPSARPGRRSASPSGPVAPAGPGPIDRAADFLVACVADGWDAEGRAVIAREWGEAGRGQRWDALLGEAEQRRLGRALLALCAGPVFVLCVVFAEGIWLGLGALLTLPPLAWGATSIVSLYGETDDPSLRD
ncbi:MAG TPA: hypothetical protein VFZ91_04495 [Allosphingosinicella sp.]